MMKQLEILAQEKQVIKDAEKALKTAELAHVKSQSDHLTNCGKKSAEIKKAKAKIVAKDIAEVVSPQANVQNMGSKKCFYIKSTNKDQSGKEFVLEASLTDKYAPKTTGVFNVDL